MNSNLIDGNYYFEFGIENNIMKNNMKGFTLIELMIVVAIIAILAAVAIPNYKQYMMESKRSDAYAALERMAAAQEDYYSNNQYVYTNVVADVGGATSPQGYYILSITMPASADSYTLTATADPAQSQAFDAGCTVITLTSASVKAPAACW